MSGKGINSVRKQAWTLSLYRLQGRDSEKRKERKIQSAVVFTTEKYGSKEISREQRSEKTN